MFLARWKLCPVALMLALGAPAVAQEALDVETYVQVVLRAHPAGRLAAGLEEEARAEKRAARQLPDPRLEYSRGRAHPNEKPAARATETGISVGQTIPWPGAYAAGIRAGARAADVLRANGTEARWEIEVAARRAFARLAAARALLELDQATEKDARWLRDLVARRTELGETPESDSLRTAVEWMRRRRLLEASRREAETAEALVRNLAVEPLPRPLVVREAAHGDLVALDRDTLVAGLLQRNPQLVAAQAEAERARALASQASQGRVPDLDVTWFKDKELDKSSNGITLGVKVPLWNANRGEVARARAALGVATAEAERRQVDLLAELDERLKDLDVARAQVLTLDKEILPSATESLRLARRSYEEGETSLLDLLDAQRTLGETQREAAESRLALALAVTDLQRLVGPDFDPWRTN